MRARARSSVSESISSACRGVPHLPGAITVETYDTKALEFVRASGYGEDSVPVVKPTGDDDVAWEAWLAYLSQIGKHRLVALARKLGTLTVPAKYPWEFSVDADRWRDAAVDLVEQRPEPPPLISAERRQQLSQALRGTMPRDLERAGYKARRKNNPHLPDSFGKAHEAEADNPIVASEALKAVLRSRSL